jgi:hypothetical protein
LSDLVEYHRARKASLVDIVSRVLKGGMEKGVDGYVIIIIVHEKVAFGEQDETVAEKIVLRASSTLAMLVLPVANSAMLQHTCLIALPMIRSDSPFE